MDTNRLSGEDAWVKNDKDLIFVNEQLENFLS